MPRGENLKGVGGPGRPNGMQNKVTFELKQMLENALHAVGGEEYLENLARDKPEIFANLLAKIIPRSLNLSSASRRSMSFQFIVEGRPELESGESLAMPPGHPQRQLE